MFKHKILLPDGTVLTSGTGTTNAIRSVKLTEQVSDQDDLTPGAACAACAELELWASENRLQITQGDVLTLYRVDSTAGSEEQVGIFLAEKPVKSSANVYKVTAYDRMTLLDKDLSPWLREQQSTFPMVLTDFIRAVCGQCGVTLEDDALTDLPNSDYQIQAFYADDLTGRQLIQWAAQAACRYVTITPAGKLTFSWYHSANSSGIGPGRDSRPGLVRLAGAILRTASGEIWRFRAKQTGYLQGTLSYQDYTTAPIDKVQIRQSDDDVGVLYPPEETATNALVLQGNMLLTTSTADALRPVAQAIYQQMQGICYTPLSVSVQMAAGLPAPGEILAVTDTYGHTMQTYIMKRTLSGQTCTLEATGNARRDSTGAVNSQSWRNLQGKMLELRTDVDGLSVKASELSGDMSSLELTVDGLSTQVKKDYTDLKNYVDTDARDAAVQEAVRQASDSFGSTLEFYPTTAQMNSAIQQSASEINLSVSQKLEGYVTDADLNQYPTTVEMNSAISQSATQIELTVDRKLSGYATTEDFTQFQLEYDQFKLQVVQDGEVRSAFAADTDSVTITSGVITFSSNTLAVNSDNFKLDKTGNVTATGVFKSNNGVSGSGRNEASLSSGSLTMSRTDSSGTRRDVVSLLGVGSTSGFGSLTLLGTRSDGSQGDFIKAWGDFDGSRLVLRNGSGSGTITLAGYIGTGVFTGDLDVQGSTGLGVSKTVSCQNLNAWGSKNRVVQTGAYRGVRSLLCLKSITTAPARAKNWMLPFPGWPQLTRMCSSRSRAPPQPPGVPEMLPAARPPHSRKRRTPPHRPQPPPKVQMLPLSLRKTPQPVWLESRTMWHSPQRTRGMLLPVPKLQHPTPPAPRKPPSVRNRLLTLTPRSLPQPNKVPKPTPPCSPTTWKVTQKPVTFPTRYQIRSCSVSASAKMEYWKPMMEVLKK